MAEYLYKAVMRDGKVTKGKLVAPNKQQLLVKLKEAKLQPLSVKKITTTTKAPKKKSKNDDFLKKTGIIERDEKKSQTTLMGQINALEAKIFKRVKKKDIIAFANNLYRLKKAGFNNIAALEALYDGTESHTFKEIIEDLLISVQSGEKLNVAMENHPNAFSKMFINFVRVGEESGSLEKALLYARDYVDSSNKLKKQITSVLLPRVLQFILILVLMFIAVIVGVPIMLEVFDIFESQAQIPPATQLAFDIAVWVQSYWYIIAIPIIGIILLIMTYVNTPRGKFNYNRMLMRFPVVGRLVTNITLNKFFKAMLLNLRNGMRLQESLNVSKDVTNNYYFLSIVEVAKNNSMVGESWITPFEDTEVFSPMVSQMMDIGMKSDLAEMMEKVNEYTEDEINESMDAFAKWLPDVTYLLVGIPMIAFVLVVVVPMIEIYMGSFIQL